MHALESGGVGSLDELELFGGGSSGDIGGGDAGGGGKNTLGLDPAVDSQPKAGIANIDSGGSDDSSSSGGYLSTFDSCCHVFLEIPM